MLVAAFRLLVIFGPKETPTNINLPQEYYDNGCMVAPVL